MMNCMVDIETLGTSPTSSILAIAAVKFEFGSDATEKFSVNIDPKSSKAFGMTVDQDTVNWWKEQKPEALKAFMANQTDIESALDSFLEFIGPKTNHMVFWANGSTFDFPIIENSLKATGRQIPWKYWNIRDARTVDRKSVV